MIYGDAFNEIYDVVEGIESHVGLHDATDNVTVNGRLNNLEASYMSGLPVFPYCEIDVMISGDTFEVVNTPVLIGDAWVVNNSVVITISEGGASGKEVDEWGDIEFQGNFGTLMGADGAYHGKKVTLTYFYSQTVLYYGIIFDGDYPEAKKSLTSYFDLVIADEITGDSQRISIDSKGRVSSYPVADAPTGDDNFVDISTGKRFQLYSENGYINWRVI